MEDFTRIYLIRHGQVKGYEEIRVYGHTDVELTDVGLLQMEAISEKLRYAPLCAIYSSDLERAVRGARILSKYHDVPIYIKESLRELYFGDWEGMPLKEIQRLFPEELKKREQDLANYQSPGNGENLNQCSERVNDTLNEIINKHRGNHVAIVAHGGVNRVILCKVLGIPLERAFTIQQDYGCLNIIDFYEKFPLVRLINGK